MAAVAALGALALAPVVASSAPPGAPQLTDTDPDSPANDNSPRVKGTADPGSTVRLYTSGDCSGAPAATGSAAAFASAGLQISVADDSTTTLRATATDAASNVSGCSSSSIIYVEDSTPPAPPRLTGTQPQSPANNNSPRVRGRATAKPWFLYVAPTAPHWPFEPEEKYREAPVPELVPNPAYFESDRSDKPPYIQSHSAHPGAITELWRPGQLRTLMSVDDLVSQVFSALESVGEADNTLAFFVSDNGFLWGEHALMGKTYPYTHSVKIPFFMRWPAALSGGADDQRIVANIDLAATIMDAAGLGPDPAVDGMSLLGSGSRDRILLERLSRAQSTGGGIPTWASIRTLSYQYTEWYEDFEYSPGDQPVFREYYDLSADPWQLTNYLGDANPDNDPSPQTLNALHDQLATDLACAGREGVAGRPACGPAGSPSGDGTRPNVLLIVTDDQRPTETLDVMPRTSELFDQQGTHFPNAFATTPVCCPSRASILTGRYAHNHGVKANPHALRLDQDSTIARRLQDAGYRTAIYGKFLNAWPLASNPPHFDQWSVFDNGPYTDFEANEQGQVKTISQYATTYVAEHAARFIKQQQDDDSTVRLYKAPTTDDCTAANLAATGTAADLASPGLAVSVPNNSSTRFRAIATDAAGNSSDCSVSSVQYTEDSTRPPGPSLTDTDPDSPANVNAPKVKGTAEAGSTVRLYKAPTTADCTPANLVATGSAAAFASPGLTASVPDNSMTRFRATATDAAGNTSVCSAGSIVYREDSTPPPGPTFSATAPASPANDNSPRVIGAAQAGSTVRLYRAPTTGGCTAANLLATGSAAAFASPGLTISVPDDSTTRVRATATDAAGNTSVCSAGSIVYREDSTPPPGPTFSDTDPDSPANNNSPKVKGAAAVGSTVRLFKAPLASDCAASNLAATGTAAAFSSPGLTVSVPDNSTTRFRATATDAAGNTSVCSTGSIRYIENSALPPSFASTAASTATVSPLLEPPLPSMKGHHLLAS